MRRSLVLSVLLLAPALAAQPCPVGDAPVSPCAEVALVALVDHAEALGLSEAQVEAIEAIRARDLHAVHEILGDIQSLQEALHGLERPYDAAEVFALFYEIDRHQAELGLTVLGAQAALMAVLTDAQRARWAELLTAAAAVHDPDAAGSVRGDAP